MDSNSKKATEETTFSKIMEESWVSFKKSPWKYLLMFSIPMVLSLTTNLLLAILPVLVLLNFGGIIETFLFENSSLLLATFLAIGFTLIFLQLFFNYLASASIFRASFESEKEKISVVNSWKISLKRTWKAAMLGIRIFFYAYMWLFIPIMIAFFYFFEDESYDQPPLVAAVIIIAIAAMIPVFIRLLSTIFALPMLMEDPAVTSKEALRKSIDLAQNRRLRIFVNTLLYGLLALLIYILFTSAINPLFLPLFPSPENISAENISADNMSSLYLIPIISSLIALPVILVTGTFAQIFTFSFLKQMKKEKNIQ